MNPPMVSDPFLIPPVAPIEPRRLENVLLRFWHPIAKVAGKSLSIGPVAQHRLD